MPSRLTLICHGPTAATRRAAFLRDEPLEPVRRAPAPLGAVDRAWTSPARAARETAALFGLDAEIEPQLADADPGLWAGRSVAEIGAAEPDAFAAWLTDPHAAPPGGEPFAALAARVGAWLDAQLPEPGRVVAVTHAGVIRAAILHVLGAPLVARGQLDITPFGRAVFSGDGRRWALRALSASEEA